ncbi:MAG: autotransporter outer membrane beta-barrel domain-containing protein, partial [Beijerinckiaceae bacterium]
STFGLAYNGQSATQTQLEIGSWIDKAMVLPGGMPVDLFGRLAYAHDWQTNPSIGASFLALPGSNFTVEGAQLPHNLALVTAGATLQLADSWKLTGKFDGEFAKGAEFYTGAARLQYTW